MRLKRAALAGQVQVQAGGGRVYATGPDNGRREWWSVSYRINVPRKNDLDLRASNGGITIVGVSGNMRFDTTNGGVKLQDVGGRVNGETRNGGLNVTLSGIAWDGEGLDVETSNGGVTWRFPTATTPSSRRAPSTAACASTSRSPCRAS